MFCIVQLGNFEFSIDQIAFLRVSGDAHLFQEVRFLRVRLQLGFVDEVDHLVKQFPG